MNESDHPTPGAIPKSRDAAIPTRKEPESPFLKNRGYAVKQEVLADLTEWAKERLGGIDKPRDTRPDWSMVNSVALYLATMALAVPGQGAVSEDELQRIAGHVVRHQEVDGFWAWSSEPPGNRPPPHFESDEVATLLAYMSLGPQAQADTKARESRERAAAWLDKNNPTDTKQAAGLRLLVKVRARDPAEVLRPEIYRFLRRQNDDGGWGQLDDLPSDAYATGQALYVLGQAGLPPGRAEVRRGVDFLVACQRADGSWPMKPRAHPGAKPSTNPVPIIYFGSAWAMLGLLRSEAPRAPGRVDQNKRQAGLRTADRDDDQQSPDVSDLSGDDDER